MTNSNWYNIDKEIPLMERFHSIQGEGYHSGRTAFFIRFAGCDVGCSWCDVKESWDVDKDNLVPISTIINEVKTSGTDFVVITGGEPGMYNLEPLTSALKAINIEIAIETSGAYSLTGQIDWICLSPKKFKLPLEENYEKANELKVIAFNNHDFKWALELSSKLNDHCQKFIQPEWDKQNDILPKIIDFVKANISWKISLQTHKYLNVR